MKDIINTIIKIVKYILIVLIIIASIVVTTNFVQLRILKKDHTNLFGYSFFVVVTNSMAPTIETDDVIIVKIGSEAKINDIITYKKASVFVTHRVTAVQKDLYIAKGDANNVGDEPVRREEVVGKVVRTFKKLGIWKKVLMTPQVFILLAITLLLFNDSFKDWTKSQYYRYRDFRITRDSIIEGKDEKKRSKK